MSRDEAVALLTTTTVVTVKQAAAVLGISPRTAYRNAQRDDQVAPGVPVIRVTEHRFIVPSAAVLRVLQLPHSNETREEVKT